MPSLTWASPPRGALLQSALQPVVPVISFDPSNLLTYGPPPVPVSFATVEAAIPYLADAGSIPLSELSLDPNVLASWGINGGTPTVLVNLAKQLLFSANAFRTGASTTILIPALNNDPHGAFADIRSTTLFVNTLAGILEGFYAELSKSVERNCGHRGQPLKLSDNVVVLVIGDTNKNPFEANGWGDSTPGNKTWIFVRSNGYLRPGWFGAVTATGFAGTFTPYEPLTGALDAGVPADDDRTAGILGILYAISRGNDAVVRDAGAGPFQGLVRTPPP